MIDKMNPAAAANAYSAGSKVMDAPGFDVQKGQSFGDVLRDAAMKTMETMRAGESATARAVTGEASLPEVVGAITASEVTLQTVVAMRDRMVTAYQEIMRMPV